MAVLRTALEVSEISNIKWVHYPFSVGTVLACCYGNICWLSSDQNRKSRQVAKSGFDHFFFLDKFKVLTP